VLTEADVTPTRVELRRCHYPVGIVSTYEAPCLPSTVGSVSQPKARAVSAQQDL